MATETLSLSLREAILIAMRDSITVQNAYLARISQRFDYRVAQNEFEPQYSAGVSLRRDSNYLSGRRFETDHSQLLLGSSLKVSSGGVIGLTYTQDFDQVEALDPDHSGSMFISFTQPLLRGFGRKIATANLSQAEYTEISSQLALKASLMSLVTTVINQYRSYLLAKDALDIAGISLQRSLAQLETNQELVNSGRLAKVELVQSETAVANQRLTLRLAQNAVDTQRLNLLLLLRLPEDVQLELTEPVEVIYEELDFDDLLDTAKANQPEYLQAQTRLKSAELNWHVNQDNQRMNLDFVASYRLFGGGPHIDDVYSGLGQFDQGDYSLGLVLTVPILDYGLKQSLVSSEVSWYQARNNFITTDENLRLSLRLARQEIETAWDSLDLARSALDLSKQQLELEVEKQRAGKSTSFQVVSYENDLAAAENRYVAAQINYLNALTALDRTLGVTLDRWGLEMVAESNLEPADIPSFYAGEPEGGGE